MGALPKRKNIAPRRLKRKEKSKIIQKSKASLKQVKALCEIESKIGTRKARDYDECRGAKKRVPLGSEQRTGNLKMLW